MEDPMRRAAFLLYLTLTVAGSLLVFSAPAEQVIQGPEVEQFLKKARFVAKEPLGSGVTASLKVTLELDGKKEFGVLKIVDQKRPGAQLNAKGEMEIDFQDSWRTEVAAYELDKLLGLGMVPATIERMSPYEAKPASLQLWVQASMSEAKRRERAIIPPNAERWAAQLTAMNIFDGLIYNTDRHPDNLLITESFDVRLIDHSRSFRPNVELRNKADLTRFPRSLVAKIEKLDKSAVNKKLGNYLTLTQIDGLMKRRDLLVDYIKELTKTLGERAVLYP
jgi:hypothetical protein